MGDLIQTGAAWLTARLTAHVSRVVGYTRGGTTVPTTATVGRSLLRVTDEFGRVAVVWTDRDYLLPADVLTALAGPPLAGDRVEDGAEVYEVMAPPGEPVWRWSDPLGKTLFRVHTKQVQ